MKKLLSWNAEAEQALQKIKQRRPGVRDSWLIRELIIEADKHIILDEQQTELIERLKKYYLNNKNMGNTKFTTEEIITKALITLEAFEK
jgi:hypothetical protein